MLTTDSPAEASAFTLDSQTGDLFYPSTTSASKWAIAAVAKSTPSDYPSVLLSDSGTVAEFPDCLAPLSCNGSSSAGFQCVNSGYSDTYDTFLVCNGQLSTYNSECWTAADLCDAPSQVVYWVPYWAPYLPDTPSGSEIQVSVTVSNGATTTVEYLAVENTASSQIFLAPSAADAAVFVLDDNSGALYLKDAPNEGGHLGEVGSRLWRILRSLRNRCLYRRPGVRKLILRRESAQLQPLDVRRDRPLRVHAFEIYAVLQRVLLLRRLVRAAHVQLDESTQYLG